MTRWPKSIPDYRWPREGRGSFIRRALLAATFHLSHLGGRVLSIARWRKSVLVIRTDGLGDAVLFEPALRSLASRFPNHDLHMWAPQLTNELLRACPFIKRLSLVPRGFKAGNLAYFSSYRWRASLGFRLGFRKFAVAIYPANSPEPLGNWLLASARATERWYNPGDLENQFEVQRETTKAVATRLLPHVDGGHELKRNAAIINDWYGSGANVRPRVHLDGDAEARAALQVDAWRREAPSDSVGMVGVMPAASMAVNEYPPERWANVVRRLWDDHRIVCAFLGATSDAATIDHVTSKLIGVPHLRLSRPLDVLATAALLTRLDALVSLDTGLAHVALAQSVPTIVLCGGGHPGRFFPWPDAERSVVLNHPMPCEGCLCRCTRAEAECITQIPVDEIVTAVTNVLRGKRVRQKSASVQRRRLALPLRQAV